MTETRLTVIGTVPCYVLNEAETNLLNVLVEAIHNNSPSIALLSRYIVAAIETDSIEGLEVFTDLQRIAKSVLSDAIYLCFTEVDITKNFVEFVASFIYFTNIYKPIQSWVMENTRSLNALDYIITHDLSLTIPEVAIQKISKNPLFNEDLLLKSIARLDQSRIPPYSSLYKRSHQCFRDVPVELISDDVIEAFYATGFDTISELENVYQAVSSRIDPQGVLPREWVKELIKVLYASTSKTTNEVT